MRISTLAAALGASLAVACAAQAEDARGDWAGAIATPAGPLHIALHVRAAPGGALTATLDSPDQGEGDIPAATVSATETTLAFTVPLVRGAYDGKWDPDSHQWVGTWTQIGAAALTLSRGPAPRPPSTCPDRAPSEAPKWCDILIWTPEQQQRAYRDMAGSFAVRTVRRGPKTDPLPITSRPLDASFTLGGETWTTDGFMRRAHAAGVLVIQGGCIRLERYASVTGDQDRWIDFSVTKSVTSTLVGAAIKDGAITGLDALVTDYLPELKGSAYDGVTVRQLITMTSGVKWNENYGDPKADIANFDRGPPGPNDESPTLAYMAKLPRAATPGTRFNYSTGDATLAGLMVARATRTPLADYLSRKIWATAGMENDATWVLAHGRTEEQGGWGLSMTLRDEGRFGLFLLNGGLAGGKAVLPDGWVADATRNHAPGAGGGYGYFWWMRPGGYSAVGVFGQTMYVNPDAHLIVVIQSAWPYAGDVLDSQAMTAFLTAVYNAARQPQMLK